MPVVNLEPGSRARVRAMAGHSPLGSLRIGAVGAQGASAVPGALLPVTLPKTLGAGTSRRVTLTASAPTGQQVGIDAVMVQPLLSTYVLGSADGGVALVSSASTSGEHASVVVPSRGRVRIEQFDGRGNLLRTSSGTGDTISFDVVAAGFTIVTR